jgi:hypothetical protein
LRARSHSSCEVTGRKAHICSGSSGVGSAS